MTKNDFEEDLLSTPQWIRAMRDHNAGRLAKAEAQYHEMIRKAPDVPNLYHNLGLIKQIDGDYGLALSLFSHALRINPDFVESENSYSNTLLESGRVQDAADYLNKSVKKFPTEPRLWFNLGNACLDLDDFSGAEKAYLRAIKLRQDFPQALLNLGNVYREEKNYKKALECIAKAIALDPDYSLAHNNYGNILSDTDRFAEAEVSYQRAIDLDPNFAIAHFNLGNVQRDQGKIEISAKSFQKTIDLMPNHGDARRHLAMTLKAKPFDASVTAMKDAYSARSTSPEDRMFMAFGLGAVCDENGLYDEAFEYFNVGNRIKRGPLGYGGDADDLFFDAIKNTFDEKYFASTSKFSTSTARPIFIVGMMRSGTTLLEQILASHPKVDGAGELLFIPDIVDPPWTDENLRKFPGNFARAKPTLFGKVADQYMELVHERCGAGAERVTDKLPQNFLYLGVISRAFPNARIINMQRNPLDVCFSIYARLFTTGHNYAYNLEELGNYYRLYCLTSAPVGPNRAI